MNVVIEVVLPIFGLMLAGYLFARARIVEGAGVRGLSAFVFNASIPALLVRSLASGAGPSGGVPFGVVYAYFSGCLIVFAAAMAIGRIFFGSRLEEQALLAINATFSNSVQLGIPLIFTAFGPAGEAPAMAIIAFHTLTLISLATVLVELGLQRGGEPLKAFATVLRALVSNPIILAILAGSLWSRTGWPLPGPLDRFLQLLGAAATPCALFVLGAGLAGLRIAGDLLECLTVAGLKLFVVPAVVWLLSRYVFALPPIDAAVATVIAAIPTGANAFILAQKYDLYVDRSASIVLITTLLSIVTLSLCIGALAPGS